MPNSQNSAPAPAAPPAASKQPKSALNSRPVRPAAAPVSAAKLLPDDPNAVPGVERWTRPQPPATTHTERLLTGMAAILQQMQQTARQATSTLTGRAFTGFAPGYRPAGTSSLRLPGFRRFWW